MKTSFCENKFQESYAQKKIHPYPYGLYKLKETLKRFESIREEVDRIACCGREGQRMYLQHCTFEDRFEYIAGLPIYIADRLGYAVYPAIDGLVGDGLTKKQTEKIKSDTKPDIFCLVKYCDITNNKILRNPNFVKSKIKQLRYEPALLLDRAIDIIEDILYGVEQALRFDGDLSFDDICARFEETFLKNTQG